LEKIPSLKADKKSDTAIIKVSLVDIGAISGGQTTKRMAEP
jgi:hypothetical protein